MKENEKEGETERDLHLDPPPVWDVDGKDLSDEDNVNDSTFGSEYDRAAELDSDDEPASTTGTNIPHFPSVPSTPVIPPTPASSTGTVIWHPLVPSSTTTIPPTQARGSTGTVNPRPLVPPSFFIDVSDGANDSNFRSEYDDMGEEVEENQVEENLIQFDSDGESQSRLLKPRMELRTWLTGKINHFLRTKPANTMGTNIPHFPSVPSTPVIPPTPARGSTGTAIRHPLVPSSTTTIPPTQARGSTGTVNPRPLVPPSSTTTIPPTQTRSSAGSKFPHLLLAPSSIFPMSSTQTRSSTGSDTSHPLARPSGPPTLATIAAPPQAEGSTPSSSRLPPAARGVNPWQMSFQSSEPRGPPPVYNPSAQSLCAVRNSRITSFVLILSLSVHADLQRETGL
jgi:hypothetical protein